MVKIEDISLLIDQLEQLLSDSRRIPLTSGALVDRDQCLLIIDQMRVTIPQQIAEARRIQEERDQVIARAEQEAQMIMERAQEEAAQVLNERGLLKEVHDRSTALAEETRRHAEETMRGADGYAIRVLGELEDQLIVEQRLRALYELLGATDNFAYVREPGTHMFSPPLRQAAYDWIDKHLKR